MRRAGPSLRSVPEAGLAVVSMVVTSSVLQTSKAARKGRGRQTSMLTSADAMASDTSLACPFLPLDDHGDDRGRSDRPTQGPGRTRVKQPPKKSTCLKLHEGRLRSRGRLQSLEEIEDEVEYGITIIDLE